MTSHEPAVTTRTDLVIDAGQSTFTDKQLAVLRQLGVEDATEGDIELFFHQAKRTGLDPFAKQIYMVGRKTKVGGYRGEPERWETKWTIQVGIDGWRLNGRRAAARTGEKVQTEGPFWQGIDGGGWNDVWLNPKVPPAAAKFTVIRDGEAFTGIAMYSEYVQTKSNGEPNAMWSKMPANQLAKCAEAAAWRKAFPEAFSGIVLEDAAQSESVQTIDGEVVKTAPPKRGVAGLKAALAPAPAADPEPAATEPQEQKASREQQQRIAELLDASGVKTKAAKLEYLQAQFGNHIRSAADITADQAAALIQFLEQPEGPSTGGAE